MTVLENLIVAGSHQVGENNINNLKESKIRLEKINNDLQINETKTAFWF